MIMLKKEIVYNLILEAKSLNFASINSETIFISIEAAKQLLSSVHIP